MKKFNSTFKIIAEIGCNHEGSFEKAVELTQLAADAGADIVKYQSYTPERFISADNPDRLERVRRFSLTKENYLELKKIANQRGILFMSTPVTEDWVEFLNPLCCAFKIASGDITFKPVIKAAAKTDKRIILSTGAATLDEIDQAIEWIQEEAGVSGLEEKLTLMHCVSAYPTPVEEANILSIPFLKERYGVDIGYSNHVMGIAACLAATALGATLIEVHFTDEKEGRLFRDHLISFDPNDLKNFVKLAKEVRLSLGKYEKKVQSCESENIHLMRKGIVAAKEIEAGDVLTEDNLMFSRPATEFCALDLNLILGKKVKRNFKYGQIISRDAITCAE